MDVEEVLCEFQAVSFPMKSAIYAWGYNQCGQTARKGNECDLRIPRQLSPKLFNVRAGRSLRWLDVACGREHTAAVASDGSLYTWGSNDYGQLGDGTEESAKHPRKVELLQTEFVKSVSCGAHCTAAIAEPRENDGTISTGRLWVWGQNQGSNYPRIYWGAFTPNTIICQVSCGAAHAVALSDEGLLQAWGYNEYGQLGRGFTCEGLQRSRVLNAYGKFVDEAPQLFVKITQVSCGEYHTAAISENGELYTWGLGNMGQLGHYSLQYEGDKELIPRRVVALDGLMIRDVACGGVHTCARTVEGALYGWGQLGFAPPRSPSHFSRVANSSETPFRNIPVIIIPSGVHLLTCGHSHTLVYMRDGRIYGWGYNNYGQAANHNSTYACFPSPVDWCVGEVRRLAAGGGHSVVLTDATTLKELCEFGLAENVTKSNSLLIQDVASRTGSDSLARLCERFREYLNESHRPHYAHSAARNLNRLLATSIDLNRFLTASIGRLLAASPDNSRLRQSTRCLTQLFGYLRLRLCTDPNRILLRIC